MKLRIDKTWDGQPAEPGEIAELEVGVDDEGLHLEVSAPYHGDPAPDAPAGALDGLWDYEVVELFVLGPDAVYTEIEVGPHGHHLVLTLKGARQWTGRCLPLTWAVHRTEERWTGKATLARDLLPDPPWVVNAYAIHGTGEQRRYLAMTPVPRPQPDYQRIEAFEVALHAADHDSHNR
jgi:hypothetical protein